MFPAVLVMQMMNTPNYIVNVQELDKILWTQKGKRVVTLTKFRNPSFCTAGVWSHLQITIFRYCPHIWKLFVLDFLCFSWGFSPIQFIWLTWLQFGRSILTVFFPLILIIHMQHCWLFSIFYTQMKANFTRCQSPHWTYYQSVTV